MIEEAVKTFIKVAERGSLSKAAEELFLSSTAVMKQINGLEREIGTALFTRSNRGMALTEAGRSLLRDARFLQEQAAGAAARARAAAEGTRRTVRVGNSLLNPCKRLLDLWNESAADGAPCDCKLQIVPFKDTVEELDEVYHSIGRKFDVMIGSCDIAGYSEMFRVLNLGAYRLCIGVPRGHRLAGKERLTLSDLEGERLVLLKRGMSGVIDAVRRKLQAEYPRIRLEDSPRYYDIGVFNRCEETGELLLTLDAWKDVHPALKTVPVDLDYVVPYGILSPLRPNEAVRAFLSVIESHLR